MARSPEYGRRTTARLIYLLKRALVDLDELHQELLAPVGISARELTVLLVLDERGPGSQQQAAGGTGVDRTTMVALLDGLEAKGLVARRPDPADRRRNVIEVTAAGHETLRQALSASDAAERRLLAGLDSAEAAQLRALLVRVADGAPED